MTGGGQTGAAATGNSLPAWLSGGNSYFGGGLQPFTLQANPNATGGQSPWSLILPGMTQPAAGAPAPSASLLWPTSGGGGGASTYANMLASAKANPAAITAPPPAQYMPSVNLANLIPPPVAPPPQNNIPGFNFTQDQLDLFNQEQALSQAQQESLQYRMDRG